jgi:flagellar hook assembly protein FlgD
VTFTLSAEAGVTAEVLNIAGRPVKVLVSERPMAAGTNTLIWDGRSAKGLAVPSGMYLVRVKAADQDGGQSEALAMVRIAR